MSAAWCYDDARDAGHRATRGAREGAAIDRDTLADLYTRYGPAVFRRARVILRDEDEARDAMQEVFTRVLEKHATFRAEAPLLAWMYRITTNLCLNRLRQRRAHPVVEDPAAVDALARGDEATHVDGATVAALLDRTDALTQQIAVYYYVDEMTMDEVAEMVGYSRKTVGKKLERFRHRARALLADRPEVSR